MVGLCKEYGVSVPYYGEERSFREASSHQPSAQPSVVPRMQDRQAAGSGVCPMSQATERYRTRQTSVKHPNSLVESHTSQRYGHALQ